MTAYVTVGELATYLGLDSSRDDLLLAQLIDSACAKIDSETGTTFAADTDATRYFDYDAVQGSLLFVDGNLCAITSVTNGDGATVAGSQYTTQPRNKAPWYALELKRTASVNWDGISGEIAIVGKWGYSQTPPEEIIHATLRLAAWYYRQRDNMGEMDRTIATGGGFVLPARIPNDVKDTLKPFKVLL